MTAAWTPSPRVARALVDHALRGETGFYLYDLAEVDRVVGEFARHAPPGVSLYYAMKANPHPGLLDRLASLAPIRGVDVASRGELEAALARFAPERILFTGPGKSPRELAAAVTAGIRLLSVESRLELERLRILRRRLPGPPLPVLVRVNPEQAAEGTERIAGGSSKFGFDEEGIPEVLREVAADPAFDLRGVHLFSASCVLDARALLAYAAGALAKARAWEAELGIPLPVVDLGGGAGVDYAMAAPPFDLAAFLRGLADLAREPGGTQREVVLELGRLLSAGCGYYATVITDIKVSRGRTHLITAGGINHFKLNKMWDHIFPAAIVPVPDGPDDGPRPGTGPGAVDVSGPLCFGDDVLAAGLRIPGARVGDLVAFPNAGAYACTWAPQRKLSHDPAEEFLLS